MGHEHSSVTPPTVKAENEDAATGTAHEAEKKLEAEQGVHIVAHPEAEQSQEHSKPAHEAEKKLEAEQGGHIVAHPEAEQSHEHSSVTPPTVTAENEDAATG